MSLIKKHDPNIIPNKSSKKKLGNTKTKSSKKNNKVNNTKGKNTKTLKKKNSFKKSLTKSQLKLLKHIKYSNMNIARKNKTQYLAGMKKIIQHYDKVYKSLPRKYINALIFYKGRGSRFINEYLYSGKINQKYLSLDYLKETKTTFFAATEGKVPGYYKLSADSIVDFVRYNIGKRLEFINTLDEMFEMAKELDIYQLTGKETLFRGVSGIKELHSVKKGQTIHFKNFLSTSLNKNTAINYALYNDYSTVYVFTKCKKVPGLYIVNNSMKAKQHRIKNILINNDLSELLLPRNLEFKVIDVIDNIPSNVDDYFSFREINKISNNQLHNKLFMKFKLVVCEYSKQLPIEPISISKEEKKITEVKIHADNNNNNI
jgi:hypothetical protein